MLAAFLVIPTFALGSPLTSAEGGGTATLERAFDHPAWMTVLLQSDGRPLRLTWEILEPTGSTVVVGFYTFDAEDQLLAYKTRANIFSQGGHHAWVDGPPPGPIASDGAFPSDICGSPSCGSPGAWSDGSQLTAPPGLLKVAVFVVGGTGAWRFSLQGGPRTVVDTTSILTGDHVVVAETEAFHGPARIAAREPFAMMGGWAAVDATWDLAVHHRFLGQAAVARISFPVAGPGGPYDVPAHLSYVDPTGHEQECTPLCAFRSYRGPGAMVPGAYTFRLDGATADSGGYAYVAGADLLLPPALPG